VYSYRTAEGSAGASCTDTATGFVRRSADSRASAPHATPGVGSSNRPSAAPRSPTTVHVQVLINDLEEAGL